MEQDAFNVVVCMVSRNGDAVGMRPFEDVSKGSVTQNPSRLLESPSRPLRETAAIGRFLNAWKSDRTARIQNKLPILIGVVADPMVEMKNDRAIPKQFCFVQGRKEVQQKHRVDPAGNRQ